jgi:hypothetical protein
LCKHDKPDTQKRARFRELVARERLSKVARKRKEGTPADEPRKELGI